MKTKFDIYAVEETAFNIDDINSLVSLLRDAFDDVVEPVEKYDFSQFDNIPDKELTQASLNLVSKQKQIGALIRTIQEKNETAVSLLQKQTNAYFKNKEQLND